MTPGAMALCLVSIEAQHCLHQLAADANWLSEHATNLVGVGGDRQKVVGECARIAMNERLVLARDHDIVI